MRLIDADALCDAMYHEAFETDTDMQKWDGGCWIRYKMFENAIDDAPTIEPKRGEWIVNDIGMFECTACKKMTISRSDLWGYCPFCGADMRGENNETDKEMR